MSNHTYKTVELTGTSPDGVQPAIENAVNRASATIRNMRWFEVSDVRGAIEAGKIAHWQVTLKVSFTLEA